MYFFFFTFAMIKTSLTRNVAAFEEYIVTEKEAVIAAGFCIAIR